jgi:ATP-dependent RNA helicase SUPV3L1/SUV3
MVIGALAFRGAASDILAMAVSASSLVAVLGPTNTGKTHLAIERMCAHSSGMIGFPLRLLAREVYDRVVRIKGERSVALITGEEKILPPDARWFLTTAESMPLERDFSFVALDEAQLGADPERGHVFTDRLLRARGRDETMILGSDALRPMLRALVPDAEIVSRPRFSTLSFAGSTKLSRLPPRSAIVAFSAEEVYAVPRCCAGSAAGAAGGDGRAQPAHPNAQVAMFQAARSIIWSRPTPSAWASTWTWRMSPSPRSAKLTASASAGYRCGDGADRRPRRAATSATALSAR